MPTYPYRCKACGHEFEEFQAITDEPIAACPKCGGETHRIIVGGVGLIFKGSGFYITDYRGDSYKKEASNDSGSGTSAGKDSQSASSDSKSESKSTGTGKKD
ncbi:zinc ribbon domain-containing protein [candidate division GN15 bacterium]|nr:zinc ribbon domain-containing protein [candidate division GN15 bacterium]